jgi:hypothetical protein
MDNGQNDRLKKWNGGAEIVSNPYKVMKLVAFHNQLYFTLFFRHKSTNSHKTSMNFNTVFYLSLIAKKTSNKARDSSLV